METPKITVNEALILAKEYHLERVIYTTIVMQPRDSGKPDRMQSLNYMQYQYHCSVWYKRVSTI